MGSLLLLALLARCAAAAEEGLAVALHAQAYPVEGGVIVGSVTCCAAAACASPGPSWGKQHDRHGRAPPPIVWAGTTFEAPALRLLGSGGAELPEAREARLCVCAAAVKSIPKFCAFINDMGANPRWTKESARKCMLIYRALEREFLEQNPDCAQPPADGLY